MPLFKFIITLANLPRLLLHLFFFVINYAKCKEDVVASIRFRHFHCSIFIGFCYLLVFDKTYRNLFYWRIGKAKYLIWYWLWPHPCFTISTRMKVGPGFLCVHPFATYVNAESIGSNFTVRNCVTIGNNKDRKGEKPIIGNNVTVNANAVVVGHITIGDNVVIGAGTVLTKSVPDNCVVVGNPAYILRENGVLVKRKL